MTEIKSNRPSIFSKTAIVLINLYKKKKKKFKCKEPEAFILCKTTVIHNGITYELEENFEDYLVISVLKTQESIFKAIEIEEEIIQNSEVIQLDTEDSPPISCNPDDIHVPQWLFLKNKSVAEYCIELLHKREIISHELSIEKNKEVVDPSSECKYKTLADILSSFDSFLRLNVNWNWMTGTRNLESMGLNAFLFYVERLMEITQVQDRERFIKDSEKFLQIYTSRPGKPDVLNHSDYWGSPQQLISGKVIADFVAEDYGTLHPVFGVLLNPTTGRVGPGDTGYMHNVLFDWDGPWANHAAVHDAFGYLKTFHNIGHGYNYLGGVSAFNTEGCMAGQGSGLMFWKYVISQKKANQTQKLKKVD